MGIQVYQALLIQRAHALGHLRRLARTDAGHDEVLAQQQLLEALDRVLLLQDVDAEYDREHAVEPRPKKQFFPRGAYRRDTLTILRRARRPMRVAEILAELCSMHQVTLTGKEQAHAACKLADGILALITQGFVVRTDKEADYRSAKCLYVVKQWANIPDTVQE